jgi:hypothetical protein
MSQDLINLKLVGFSEYEAQIIESVLSLAERGLLKKWRLVTDLPADYYLLPGSLIERMNQEEVLKTLPRNRCIFSSKEKSNADGESQGRWLLCDSRNVPRIRSMIGLFNLLCEDTPAGRNSQGPAMRTADEPSGEVAPAAETEWPSAAAQGEVFDSHDGFIGELLDASNKTGVPIPLVKDFYNACEIVGLIEQSPKADIHNKRLNPEKVGLFSKIRSRLSKASPT